MSEDGDTLLARAFAAGAANVSVMKIGDDYVATISAWRTIDDHSGVSHSEHASSRGEGSTPDFAMREAIAKLQPTPAIEVREIKRNRALGEARDVVPAALADRVTRIKGLLPPPVEPAAIDAVERVADETGS